MNETQQESGVPGEDTRDRLIEAGRSLFAARGFAGTSVRDLTQEAGVNLGAVTYHFETKQGLYLAVLEACLSPVRERLGAIANLPVPPSGRLELFVRAMFQHLREHPDIPRFMVQEIVLGDAPAPPVLKHVRFVLGTLTSIIKEGQREGAIAAGDPVLMALSILSQPLFLSLMPVFLKRGDLSGADLPRPRASAEDHGVAFLRSGLFAHPENR